MVVGVTTLEVGRITQYKVEDTDSCYETYEDDPECASNSCEALRLLNSLGGCGFLCSCHNFKI
jgi:hypothetical protein